MKQLKTVIIGGSLLAVFAVCSICAEGFNISSSSVLLSGVPGRDMHGKFFVSADTDNLRAVDFETEVKTWFLLDANREISLAAWLRIRPKEFTLEPGAQTEIRYDVTVPVDAEGFLMAMVTFETLPEKEEEKIEEVDEDEGDEDAEGEVQKDDSEEADAVTGSEEGGEEEEEPIMIYSIPVYLGVTGKTSIDFRVARASFTYTEEVLHAAVTLENTGNFFIRASTMTLHFVETDGIEKVSIILDPVRPLFPARTAEYRGSVEQKLEKGSYTMFVVISGRYPAFEVYRAVPVTVSGKGVITVDEEAYALQEQSRMTGEKDGR